VTGIAFEYTEVCDSMQKKIAEHADGAESAAKLMKDLELTTCMQHMDAIQSKESACEERCTDRLG
jgi:hypothetical protein